MRQVAWLNARPDKAEGDKTKTPEPTRRQRLKVDGIDAPPMPDCAAHYLVAYLFELGPTAMGGGGEGPISHTELACWMGNTGIALTSWEARTLRRLSSDYLTESHQATTRGHPAPWQSPDAPPVERLVNTAIQKNAFRALAQL